MEYLILERDAQHLQSTFANLLLQVFLLCVVSYLPKVYNYICKRCFVPLS